MKIEINLDPGTLVLTNEHLDNFNYVDVHFGENEGQVNLHQIPLDELHAAVTAFRELRAEQDRREQLDT